MKRILVIIGIMLIPTVPLRAAPAAHIVMSEIQIGATGFSTDEFVELHNPTDSPVDITGWQLIKRTASGGTFPLVDVFPALILPAHGYVLIAHPTGYRGAAVPDMRYTTTNSLSADNSVELINPIGVVDVVGWGAATIVEGTPTSTPGSGKSIERKALGTSTKETMSEDGADSFRGNEEDTDHNDADWVTRDLPDPQNLASELEFVTAPAPIVPAPTTNANTNSAPVVKPTSIPVVAQPAAPSPHTLLITEILPDPKGADATEEFIEILNTGEAPVELVGWKLQDVSTSKYLFTTGSLAPGAYRSVKRPESGIALNNTNGETVTLTAPDGVVTSTVSFTGSALEGQSYAFIDNQWKWTGTPTPGLKNAYADGNHAPEAKIKDVETDVRVGNAVSLSAAPSTDPDGDDLEFRWQFSDGGNATGTKVTHQFTKPGKMLVTLTATDVKGKVGKATLTFNVRDFDRSNAVVITAILPNPADGEEEYVELFNGDSKAIDLAGWVLRNGTRTLKLTGVLAAKATQRLGEDDLPFALRNDGATLELLDPDGKVISSLTYAKALAGVVAFPGTVTAQSMAAITKTSPTGANTNGKVAGAVVAATNASKATANTNLRSTGGQAGQLPVWSWLVIGGVAATAWGTYEFVQYRRRKR
ncbi:MAG: lamin tail domain-containing protein [Patescibacteria group bacterium]